MNGGATLLAKSLGASASVFLRYAVLLFGVASSCAASVVGRVHPAGAVAAALTVVPGRDHGAADSAGTDRIGVRIDQADVDAPPQMCIGDCDANGSVSVDELVTLVRIALADTQPSTCPQGIPSDVVLDIVSIVRAVNSALSGCPLIELDVATSGTVGGDGSVAHPYRRITDAVARAREARAGASVDRVQPIRIHVAPGTYVGSFDAAELRNHPDYEVLPIILNVPGLALLGGTVLLRDERSLPTEPQPGSETILQPDTHLAPDQYLFLVTRTSDGAVGNDVTIDGFTLDGRGGDYPGADVFVDRVSGFRIRNNLVQHAAFGILTRLASGDIEGNLLADNLELGSAVTGGSLAYPATVLIHGNRANHNAAHGLGHVAAGWIALQSDPGQNTVGLLEPLQTLFDRNRPEDVQNIPDTLTVTITDNDASDNGIGNPTGGIGIRFGGIWPDFDYRTADASQPSTSVLMAEITDNTATGNGAYGVDLEAGDTNRLQVRQFIQTMTARLRGNVFAGNGRAGSLFTFTYWLVSVDVISPYVNKYAEQSTYALTDGDGELAGFDYDNPVSDDLVGTILNNTLTVNGVEAPRGKSVTPAS